MFIAFRFISGMGSWWLLGAIPIWIREISPPHNRGGLVDIHSAFLLIGYATAAWIGYAFFHYHPAANNQWRAPIGLQCLFPFLNLCIIRFLPESPRWLLFKGREEQARVVLEKLHGRDEMEVEFREIKAQILSDSAYESTWRAVATKPSYRKRALLTMAVAFGIQMTGVLVVNSKYSNTPIPCIADSRHRLWTQNLWIPGVRWRTRSSIPGGLQHTRGWLWHARHFPRRPFSTQQILIHWHGHRSLVSCCRGCSCFQLPFWCTRTKCWSIKGSPRNALFIHCKFKQQL